MRIILRNLICHRRKNIIMLLTAIFSTVLLNTYTGNIISNQNQLNELAKITPVYCFISNVRGSKIAGIDIHENILKAISDSEYTKDIAYTVKVNGGIGNIPLEEWYKLGYNVLGLNSINALSDLSYDDITMEGDKEAFFASDENIALLSHEYMMKNGLKTGDEIPYTLFYYQYDDPDIYCNPLDVITLKIAGEMAERVSGPEGNAVDVLIPAAYLKKVFDANNVRFFADSLSFYISDPLKLNSAKKQFKDMILLSRSPDAMESFVGIGLNIKDSTFISLAGNIMRNIMLLKIFVIPLCILVFTIGALISFILMRSWQDEYVTMRLLGIYEYQCMTIYLSEALSVSLIGVFLGHIIIALLQKSSTGFAYSLLIITAYIIGTAISSYVTKIESKGGNAWK